MHVLKIFGKINVIKYSTVNIIYLSVTEIFLNRAKISKMISKQTANIIFKTDILNPYKILYLNNFIAEDIWEMWKNTEKCTLWASYALDLYLFLITIFCYQAKFKVYPYVMRYKPKNHVHFGFTCTYKYLFVDRIHLQCR